jgi:hypothetical protein
MSEMAKLTWRYAADVLTICDADDPFTVHVYAPFSGVAVDAISRLEAEGRSAEGLISGLYLAGMAHAAHKVGYSREGTHA